MPRIVPVAAVALALLVAAPAAALTRRELACQAAIAKAGRVYVTRELAQRARCWIAAVQGKPCADEDAALARTEKLVTRLLRRCRGVALARLGGNGCVAQGTDVASLTACVLETHADAVDTLLAAQFGFALTPAARTPCGVRCPPPAGPTR